MKGNPEFQIEWPDREQLQPTKAKRWPKTDEGDKIESVGLDELAFDDELYEKLRDVRAQLAKEAGGVPAYVIFSNQVLEFFTRLRPTSEEQALRIRGVGKVKAERYLQPFLEAIREFDES